MYSAFIHVHVVCVLVLVRLKFFFDLQLPDCQETTYRGIKTQQELEIARIVAGDSEKIPEMSADQLPWKYHGELKKLESNIERDRRKKLGQMGAALNTHHGGEKELANMHNDYVHNMHIQYANDDNANSNIHAKYANEFKDTERERFRENGQLTIQGNSARQSVDGVFRRSAINENQRDNSNTDYQVGGVGGEEDRKVNGMGLQDLKRSPMREQYLKMPSNGLADDRTGKEIKGVDNVRLKDPQSRNLQGGGMDGIGLKQMQHVGQGTGNKDLGLNKAQVINHQDGKLGLLQSEHVAQDIASDNLGQVDAQIQQDWKLAQQQMQHVGLGVANVDDRMWYSSASRVAAHYEGSPSQRLEWEKAREELDGYRGAGQGELKSQVDVVADLWQRENEEQPKNSR